jgi:fatty acid desaturase/cytochrome b involved in lipid metabolism
MVTHDAGDADSDILVASPTDRKVFYWSEIRKHNTEESPWLVINGKVYDVTEFQHRHPGGDMILLGAGRHSTELFWSHHPSKVIESGMIDKYYIGDVAEEEDEKNDKKKHLDLAKLDVVHLYKPGDQTKFYSTLRHRVEEYLKKKNLKPRDSTEMYIKTFLSFTVWFLLYLGTHFSNSWILSILSAILFGFASANIGMSVMHDGNHGGYSNSPLVNRIMGGTFDFLGGSSFVWKMIHSVGHHVHTNVEELDPDIHTAEPHFRRIKGMQKPHFWYKYQHIYLPFLYSILIFELYIRDFVAMAKGSWGGVPFQPAPRREWILFWLTKVWFLCFFFGVPLLYHDLYRIMIVNCIALLIAGELLVLMFQVNHVTQAANSFHADSKGVVSKDWAISQVEGSSNFASGSWLWNHLSGGLNHQTEHHLFPTISHVHYPKLHPIVKKTCDEFGVRYNSYPNFWEAICGHFALLKEMGAAGIKYEVHID